jgi:hypothetical protein
VALEIWDRVKSSLGLDRRTTGEGAGRVPIGRIEIRFGSLANAQRGLPQQVADYIATGTPAAVLLTLQGNAVRTAWRERKQFGRVTRQDSLLTSLADWRPDQLQRFGEVLDALEPITQDWGYFGTKASPGWLRHVVSQWLVWESQNEPVAVLEAMCEAANLGIGPVLDILFCRDALTYRANGSVSRFAGVDQLLASRREAVAAALPGASADVRAPAIATIGRFGLQGPYLPLLLDAAVGSAKKVRAAALQALTGSDTAALAALIADRFATAAPGARAELAEVAAQTLGSRAAETLAPLRAGETNPKVLAALDRVAGSPAEKAAAGPPQRPDSADGYTAVDGSWVALPPLPPLPGPTPFDRRVLDVLAPAAAEFNRLLAADRAEAKANRWHWSRQFQSVDRAALERLARLAEGDHSIAPPHIATEWMRSHYFRHPAVPAFLHDPRLSAYHLVRIALAMAHRNFHVVVSHLSEQLGSAFEQRVAAGTDIRTINALWLAHGGDDFILEHLTRRWYFQMPAMDMAIWPLLAGRLELLDEALGLIPQSRSTPMHINAGLELLALFPQLPERYRARLLQLAADSSSHVRVPARALLAHTPDLGDAIAEQLGDGRQDIRAQAADWLARRGERAQAPAIRQALGREKSDVARAAMISALERLGEDVSEYFAPERMIAEARAGLARLKLKGLEWFPFDRIPQLHWVDGSPVDPLLPRWWVMLAAKVKQPGGNAMMTLWLDRLAPGDAHRLGWMVLTCWIDEDTRTHTDEEANAHAAAHVDAVLQQNIANARRWPDSADFFPTDRSVVFARLKASVAKAYLGSAADSKGILALCARVNGADAAQRVRAFLKDHGARVSQAKALLEALAANGSSAALQVVLAAANRSKQKSVQAHAADLIAAIADRNGWSPAQLADRTVPSGGLDADGTLELDCGEGRTYTARLDDQDAIVLFNAEGREVKALPGPRVDEERPVVEAAKKLLYNARKETRQVLAAQAERLQEAMCLQRDWPREDWESFIAGHPIVGRVAARLVWRGFDDNGQPLALFRPLGDGSHTDADDGDVDIAGFASIRLAHSSLLDAGAIAAWRRHLADYAVTPPFDQLGRDLPKLGDAQGAERAINDRMGWMIETFKLRGAAGKLGWQRGAAQDGGWCLTYEKSYRQAGLLAEIEFTGSPLPEENRQAALQSLQFRKLAGGGSAVPLRDVPPVLLAECWRDFHDIAEKGTGFDAAWKQKAY